MTIEISLLITEIILLLVTIILLMYSMREASKRKELLQKVGKATETLNRVEYFSIVNRSIIDAKNEIAGYVTGSRPLKGDENEIRVILDAINRAHNRGVNIRYILPRMHDRLHMGYKYKKAGAKVRYKSGLMTQSLRYMLTDGQEVVLGVPGWVGRQEMTNKGCWLPSKALVEILQKHFENDWEAAISFEEYLETVIDETGASTGSIATELGISPNNLERERQNEEKGEQQR